MKRLILILTVLSTTSMAAGQMVSGAADVFTVYSQNERFYLKSIPYDDRSPSLRGKTYVYERGKAAPLYTLDRGFDSTFDDSNILFLSNDGEVIFYVVTWGGDEQTDGLKSVNVYKHGQLIRSFTETEITGCDEKKERCKFVYSNYDQVVDKVKSNWGTSNYKKVLKAGVDEKERFLNDFALFSFDDMVYLTDSKERIHVFDLRDGRHVESDSFENMFDRIKDKGRATKSEVESYKAPSFLKFPNLQNGANTNISLANYIGMKARGSATERDRYKWYTVKIDSTISQDGTVEIETIDVDSGLPKEKILEFFKTNKFDTHSIPKAFEKWHLREQSLYLRKTDNRVALQEKRQESIKERAEFEKRLAAESINGVYIPANLGECFVELDKQLSEIDKQEMKAMPNRDQMIRYHRSIGMWMRNNWGLWGGSRLWKYFRDRGESHPEEISSIILEHYHDWLHDKQDTWKDWENKSTKRTRR